MEWITSFMTEKRIKSKWKLLSDEHSPVVATLGTFRFYQYEPSYTSKQFKVKMSGNVVVCLKGTTNQGNIVQSGDVTIYKNGQAVRSIRVEPTTTSDGSGQWERNISIAVQKNDIIYTVAETYKGSSSTSYVTGSTTIKLGFTDTTLFEVEG